MMFFFFFLVYPAHIRNLPDDTFLLYAAHIGTVNYQSNVYICVKLAYAVCLSNV